MFQLHVNGTWGSGEPEPDAEDETECDGLQATIEEEMQSIVWYCLNEIKFQIGNSMILNEAEKKVCLEQIRDGLNAELNGMK